MAYTTVADLKTYMGGIAGSGDDALLGDLIDQAKAIINSKYNRTFEAAADTTRYFHAVEDVAGHCLLIDEDLCAITSITNGDGAAVSASDYTVTPKNDPPWYEIKLKLSASVAWTYSTTPEDAIVVVGRWAYSATPPDDIVFLCQRMASWMYRARKGEYDRATVSPTGQMLLPSKLVTEIEALRPKYYPEGIGTMTSQISAIYATIAGVSVTAAGKTPSVYYGSTAVDNVEAYGLPARLLLPTFSQAEGRGAKFVSVSPGNLMVAQWQIADLMLWQEVGLGSGVDAFVAALVAYCGAYLDAFKPHQKLGGNQITLEQIDVSPDVYEYPMASNRWYAGVLCTLHVKEIIS